MASSRFISILTPTFNEEECIGELIRAVSAVLISNCLDYEHIIIDNKSNDSTVQIVKDVCKIDNRVKLVVNANNYGQVVSPVAGILMCSGAAVIVIAADFENPVELLPRFIGEWLGGADFVLGVVADSDENLFHATCRKFYYSVVAHFSASPNVPQFNGFCLLDRKVVEYLRLQDTFYLFLRHEILCFSSNYRILEYRKVSRKSGISKNNFATLLDIAMVGFVAHNVNVAQACFFCGLLINLVAIVFYFLRIDVLIPLVCLNTALLLFLVYFQCASIRYRMNQSDARVRYRISERVNFS